MKRLTITYNGVELFDQDVDEFSWSESDTAVTVQGKVKAARPAGGGLLEMLTANRKQQTQQIVTARRSAFHSGEVVEPQEIEEQEVGA